jgi:hypothetical protein
MERQELIQLDSNIAKLQKTLSHQSEEIAKQDDLNQLKLINSDMARQEMELKVYQNRLAQYLFFLFRFHSSCLVFAFVSSTYCPFYDINIHRKSATRRAGEAAERFT